jgi:ZIP family zinc transporter
VAEASAFRTPGTTARSVIQHIAAGTLFAGLVVEVLAELLANGRSHLPSVIGGFALGLAAMLTIRIVMKRQEQGQGGATSLGVTIIADVSVDDILMGLTMAGGSRAAIVFAVALAPETFLLGITAAEDFSQSKDWAWLPKIGVTAAIGLAILFGAFAGGLLRLAPDAVRTGLLAFGAIAISYLVMEELLREAHGQKASPTMAAMFFVGFMPFFLAGMVLSR